MKKLINKIFPYGETKRLKRELALTDARLYQEEQRYLDILKFLRDGEERDNWTATLITHQGEYEMERRETGYGFIVRFRKVKKR